MDDDYESLPSDSKVTDHMLAGALAGVLEHTLVYPVDSIKTRLQCIRPVNNIVIKGVADGLYHIFFKEGIKKNIKGIGAVVSGAGPAHAMYFASYEWIKHCCTNSSVGYFNSFGYATSGAIATSLHDAIMTPADAIKQRLQMYQSPYQNSYQCLQCILKNEGISVLYRAYVTQLTMNIPYHSCYILIYEHVQNLCNPQRTYLPSAHLLAASLAAAVASLLTNPLDVCKTVLNTQDHCAFSEWSDKKRKITGVIDSAKLIYQYEGTNGFFRGAFARMIYAIPGSAISWLVYETFKHYLQMVNK